LPRAESLAAVLMVQGTASSVGKSTLTAGLCRLFRRRGLRVAPFKAQNMSNNAAVCPGGGEIGRAQFAQAVAAGVAPGVDMNPILLKPQQGAAQVIVRGQVVGAQTAAEYFGARRQDYWPIVAESLDRLRAEYDLVIAEGAGSPAEINLRARDIVNMRVALHAAPRADVLLVADIDRGGAFASLLGTLEWLAPEERALVRGSILNRFRGDVRLLAPAPEMLAERSGVAVLGVVPYLERLGMPEEDAASLSAVAAPTSLVEVAILRLPHLSNFDEFGPLALEPGVRVVYVDAPEQLRAPDLVIVPGSKATVPDLCWLHERGLAERIVWLAHHGTPVLGVCGGMQMLGARVRDQLRIESAIESAPGLGLLPLETALERSKTLRQVHGTAVAARGFWACLNGAPVAGYEIHLGHSASVDTPPLLRLDGRTDGAVLGDIAGTYVHGLFEGEAPRFALVRALVERRGFVWQATAEPPRDPYDRLADVLEQKLDFRPLTVIPTTDA
jgi:adenosylcobyric acid synthase